MTKTTNPVQFTDAAYRRSWGKAPRGSGVWAFQAATSRAAYSADLVGDVFFTSGTLTEAKAKVLATFDLDAGAIIAVLP